MGPMLMPLLLPLVYKVFSLFSFIPFFLPLYLSYLPPLSFLPSPLLSSSSPLLSSLLVYVRGLCVSFSFSCFSISHPFVSFLFILCRFSFLDFRGIVSCILLIHHINTFFSRFILFFDNVKCRNVLMINKCERK